MAIKTKYNVPVSIDDNVFDVIVHEPSKAHEEEIKEVFDRHKDSYIDRDAIQEKLTEAQNDFSINREILDHGAVKEKASVWFEQKKLNKEIPKLTKELSAKDEELDNINKLVELAFEKRFELLVSGEGKAALKKEMDDKNISYKVLFQSISSLIQEAKEKK